MSGRLSVGITTHNRPDAVLACLASLKAIAHLSPDVLVYDDGSDPPVETAIGGEGAGVRFLRGTGGCAAGRNRLVAEASGRFVLLLDDDTRLLDAAGIESALAAMSRDATIGAVAFPQANADGSLWPSSMQPSNATRPALVPCFIGFAHLVRREAFLGIGGYRANFQYYGEEKELCLRLLDRGYPTLYLPSAPIAHLTDPRSRNLQKYLRLVSRNDCLNSLYNDPLARMLWTVPARLYLYFRMRHGWKIHDPGGAWWIVSDLVRHLPETLRRRRPVARATLRRWRRLKASAEPWPAESAS